MEINLTLLVRNTGLSSRVIADLKRWCLLLADRNFYANWQTKQM